MGESKVMVCIQGKTATQGATHYYAPSTNTSITTQKYHQASQSTLVPYIHIIEGAFLKIFSIFQFFLFSRKKKKGKSTIYGETCTL